MRVRFAAVFCALAVVVACTKHPSSPSSPSATMTLDAAAGPGGVTLKVSPPTPQSPINGQKVPDTTPGVTLVVGNSTPLYAANGGSLPLSYRFEVYNAAGTRVYTNSALVASGTGTTSHALLVQLEGNQTHTWQARAEYQGYVGAWSPRASFISPAASGGYISGAELYDPLVNGTTVGQIDGPVEWIPGVGVKLLDWTSYISYELPQTLTEGEFSLIVTNLRKASSGDKQKVMAMAQGYSDIIENDRRMTVEKRGSPAGAIAWRFITHDDRIETEGDTERVEYNFQATQDYFYQATWRSNFFDLLIREGGVAGRLIYERGKSWKGAAYDPKPHVIYVGSPVGRSGASAASIENTIYRQVWVSARPRPASAR